MLYALIHPETGLLVDLSTGQCLIYATQSEAEAMAQWTVLPVQVVSFVPPFAPTWTAK